MNTPTTPQTPDVPETPDTTGAPDRTDATLADDVFADSERTEAIPTGSAPQAAPTTSWATPAAATATATAPAPTPAAAPAVAPAQAPVEPEYLRGPAPFALVLGLLGLLVAGSVLVGELTDVSLPWNDLGPWSVVAAGVLVLLVGAIGLRSSRARD